PARRQLRDRRRAAGDLPGGGVAPARARRARRGHRRRGAGGDGVAVGRRGQGEYPAPAEGRDAIRPLQVIAALVLAACARTEPQAPAIDAAVVVVTPDARVYAV